MSGVLGATSATPVYLGEIDPNTPLPFSVTIPFVAPIGSHDDHIYHFSQREREHHHDQHEELQPERELQQDPGTSPFPPTSPSLAALLASGT